MAANFLGLFVLILGTTGISKMLSHAEMADYALRSYWNRFKPYYVKDDRESLDCRYKYRPYACKNVYNPPNFGSFLDYNFNSKRQENFIPGQFNPYLRRNYIEELSERMQKLILEDRASTVTAEVKQNPKKDGNSDDAYSSPKSIISSTQRDNSIEKHTIKRQDVSNYFPSESSPLSDKSRNSNQPDTTLSATTNMASDLYVTDQSFSDLKISESIKDTTIKTSSKDATEYKSSFFIKRLTDATDQSNIDPITSYSPTPDNKKINTISSTTTSSSQEHLIKSKDEKFQTDSVILQDNSSVISEEVTVFEGESNSTVDISISTNNQDSDLESTQSQNTPLSTADEAVSSYIKSSSSEEMYSSSTQISETGIVTPKISTILITDDTTLYSKLSSSSDIKSTDGKTSNDKSSTDYFTSSNKFTSTPSTIKDIESDTTFSTKSTSKNQVTSVDMPKDHIIEISSIHTARIIITSVFLVIALVAITVLAVYIFKLKRKTVYYDQLLLLP